MQLDWVTLIIPVAVPIIIAGLKFGISKIPGWLLPIIAPILDGLLDAGISWATGHQANPIAGAILGSAGVGVRELKDQLLPAK